MGGFKRCFDAIIGHDENDSAIQPTHKRMRRLDHDDRKGKWSSIMAALLQTFAAMGLADPADVSPKGNDELVVVVRPSQVQVQGRLNKKARRSLFKTSPALNTNTGLPFVMEHPGLFAEYSDILLDPPSEQSNPPEARVKAKTKVCKALFNASNSTGNCLPMVMVQPKLFVEYNDVLLHNPLGQ
ncbi:MAG: hypothetical protein OIF50_17795 [Flavobacteriaceae bacterium]|nr:hypothetical protein [Flavobacteriaceae bacterium]